MDREHCQSFQCSKSAQLAFSHSTLLGACPIARRSATADSGGKSVVQSEQPADGRLTMLCVSISTTEPVGFTEATFDPMSGNRAYSAYSWLAPHRDKPSLAIDRDLGLGREQYEPELPHQN